MKAEFDSYVRLARSLFGMSSLWMGEDHLVYVRGRGFFVPFVEHYRRYRYGDIQALAVARTSRWRAALVPALAILLFAVPMVLVLAMLEDGPGPTAAGISSFLAIGALASFAVLLRQIILGPGCICEIQTNVSRDRIRALTHHHRAVEAVGRVEERIRRGQEHLRTGGDAIAGETSRPAAARRTEGLSLPRVVAPTFATFLLFGLGCLAALHLESLWLIGGVLASVVLVSILLIFSLVVTVRRATPESIRAGLWLLLGLLFLLVGSGMVYYLVAAVANPAYTVGVTGPMEAFAGITAEGGTVGYLVFLGLALALFVVGLIGLIDVGRWGRRLARSGVGATEGNARGEDPNHG